MKMWINKDLVLNIYSSNKWVGDFFEFPIGTRVFKRLEKSTTIFVAGCQGWINRNGA